MQMLVRFLAGTVGNRILGRFQLHNHTGKALRERVVNVPRHSISFFEDRRSLTLLGKFIELKGKHDLMGERLSQFDFFRPIRCPVGMADSNKTPDVSAHQNRNSQKSFCSLSLQIIAPFGFDARSSVQVFANHRTCREKQFLDYCVLFPEKWVLYEWMLRVRRDQFPPSAIERKASES